MVGYDFLYLAQLAAIAPALYYRYLMAEPTYSEQLPLRVTPDQKRLVQEASEAADLSQQEYMRQRIFGKPTQFVGSSRIGPVPISDPWRDRTDARLAALEALPRRRPPVAQLYEYAVILQEKRDKDGEEIEAAQIIVSPTTVLARDEGQAQMLAARAIPEEIVGNGKLDRLVVVCRPF